MTASASGSVTSSGGKAAGDVVKFGDGARPRASVADARSRSHRDPRSRCRPVLAPFQPPRSWMSDLGPGNNSTDNLERGPTVARYPVRWVQALMGIHKLCFAGTAALPDFRSGRWSDAWRSGRCRRSEVAGYIRRLTSKSSSRAMDASSRHPRDGSRHSSRGGWIPCRLTRGLSNIGRWKTPDRLERPEGCRSSS